MIKGRSVPALDQFRQFAVNALGTDDIQWLPLFDFQLYAAAGQQNLTFFSQQIGAGTTSHPGGAGPKTIADTNMTLSGQIPAPQKFMVCGIELVFWSGLNPGRGPVAQNTVGQMWNDVMAVARGGSLTFTIGQKIYCQDAPLGSFAQQTALDGIAAVADATTAGANLLDQVEYAAIRGAVYQVPPQVIPNGQNFNVTLAWPNVIALPSANATSRIGVKLLGWQSRAVQ